MTLHHRQTQYHDPSNAHCSYSNDPHAWGPDASDWCSCPLPPPAWQKQVDRPAAMGERGKVAALDAGWDAHAAGLERKTVEVFSANNGMALLGWDIRDKLTRDE